MKFKAAIMVMDSDTGYLFLDVATAPHDHHGIVDVTLDDGVMMSDIEDDDKVVCLMDPDSNLRYVSREVFDNENFDGVEFPVPNFMCFETIEKYEEHLESEQR